MNRKIKNILLISVIFILITCLSLTFYCGLNNNYKDNTLGKSFVQDNNKSIENTDSDTIKDKDSEEVTKKESDENAVSEETDNTKTNDETKENTSNGKMKSQNIQNRDSNSEKFRHNRPIMKSNYENMNIKSQKEFAIKYVIMVMIESLLLGGTIVLLVYNNLPNNITVKKDRIKDSKDK